MTKLRTSLGLFMIGVLALPTTVSSAMLGPVPALCNNKGPSILVRVSGFKNRAGKIRVRTFGGSPDTYFDKKRALLRVEYNMPQSGTVDVCMPVPRAGVYAVDVRHDINNNSDTDRADGAGASGNPKVGMMDIIFGRKPPAKQVQVQVGTGTTTIPIVVRYM
jgi:uncharacterized protein (DUF2141 family)